MEGRVVANEKIKKEGRREEKDVCMNERNEVTNIDCGKCIFRGGTKIIKRQLLRRTEGREHDGR